MELVFLKSLFEAEDIHYYVLNDHFGTLRVGPKIDLFNAKIIYIHEPFLERAKEIVEDLRASLEGDNASIKTSYSSSDKIRMVIETMLFMWFIPGNRWNRKNSEKGQQRL